MCLSACCMWTVEHEERKRRNEVSLWDMDKDKGRDLTRVSENTQRVLLAVALGPIRLVLIRTCFYSVLSL